MLDYPHYHYKTEYRETDLVPFRSAYQTFGNTAIVCYTEEEGYPEPYFTLSVNIDPLPANMIAVDTNNCLGAEKFLTENNLGKPTGNFIASGFCKYPIYIIDLDKFPLHSDAFGEDF